MSDSPTQDQARGSWLGFVNKDYPDQSLLISAPACTLPDSQSSSLTTQLGNTVWGFERRAIDCPYTLAPGLVAEQALITKIMPTGGGQGLGPSQGTAPLFPPQPQALILTALL